MSGSRSAVDGAGERRGLVRSDAPRDRRDRSRQAVRQAGALFLAAGAIGLFGDLVQRESSGHRAVAIAFDLLNVLVGVACSTVLTHRLSGDRSMVLAGFALGDFAINNVYGNIPTSTLGIWIVLIYVWIGEWHTRRMNLAALPVATVAYLLPFHFGAPQTSELFVSAAIVLPVALLIGLTIERSATVARRAELEQIRALDALATATVTDDLTTLGNRRFGDALLDGLEWGDTIALLDLDNFKGVNDRLGHSVGDGVLRDLGEFLRRTVDHSEDVARMGGEEFMIVYRDRSLDDATEATNKLVEQWSASAPLSTLSAGIAHHVAPQSSSETYGLADDALYSAKAAGRNRTARADAVEGEVSRTRQDVNGDLDVVGPVEGVGRRRMR